MVNIMIRNNEIDIFSITNNAGKYTIIWKVPFSCLDQIEKFCDSRENFEIGGTYWHTILFKQVINTCYCMTTTHTFARFGIEETRKDIKKFINNTEKEVTISEIKMQTVRGIRKWSVYTCEIIEAIDCSLDETIKLFEKMSKKIIIDQNNKFVRIVE